MAESPLQEFIKHATRAGQSHGAMRAVLLEAGWEAATIDKAFESWHEAPFPVAVPRPESYVSPRYAALNLFFFVVLYFAIWAGTAIIFTYLDYYLPDGLGQMRGLYYSGQPIAETLRQPIATLVVTAPLVWICGSMLNRVSSRNAQYAIPVIRLRLISLTLLVSAFVVLGDFIYFVNYLLSGELGIRFAIKSATLLIAMLGVYGYFGPEIRRDEKRG